MSWQEIIKNTSDKDSPMDKVTSTTSTGQDEEAAKRTEEKESELLAQIRARNAKARGGDISKIKLPFGRNSKKKTEERVTSIFQEEIGKATTIADLVKAMEQFANQPPAQEIWSNSESTIPLPQALENAQTILNPAKLSEHNSLKMISAGYQDDKLDDHAGEEELLLEYIQKTSTLFSRAFGIRDKAMEIYSSNPKAHTKLFDKIVQERKAKINQSKPQMSMAGNTTGGDAYANNNIGKMQGWQDIIKDDNL